MFDKPAEHAIYFPKRGPRVNWNILNKMAALPMHISTALHKQEYALKKKLTRSCRLLGGVFLIN